MGPVCCDGVGAVSCDGDGSDSGNLRWFRVGRGGDPGPSRSPPHGRPAPHRRLLCVSWSPRCLVGPSLRVGLETWEWVSFSGVEWADGSETVLEGGTDGPPDLQTIVADGTAQRLFR